MITPYHTFAQRAEDEGDYSGNLPVVAIAVSVGAGSIVLAVIIYRLLRGFFHKKRNPLPPPQPLAHYRAQFLDRNDSASRPSTGYSTRQSSVPRSTTLNTSSEQGSTYSLIASKTPSTTRPSPAHSVGDLSQCSTMEHAPSILNGTPRIPVSYKEPFPTIESEVPGAVNADPSLFNPIAIPPGSRSRPVSSSSLTAQLRASRRISSSGSIRVRCAPHRPHSGVQVVLPSPLAPTLFPGEIPGSLPGAAGDKWNTPGSRMSLVDAWASVPFRDLRPEKSTDSSLRRERTLSNRSQSSSLQSHNRNPSLGDHSQQLALPPVPPMVNSSDLHDDVKATPEGPSQLQPANSEAHQQLQTSHPTSPDLDPEE